MFAALLLALCACNGAPSFSSSAQGHAGSALRTTVQSSEEQFAPPTAGSIVARLQTSLGNIDILLFPQYAPLAVENFRLLAESNYYQGALFHRVVENFVIQGGDPTGDGGQSAWGEPFPVELCGKLRHYAGALCMVNTAGPPGENGSQFYIVAAPQGGVSEETQQALLTAGIGEGVVDAYAQAGGAPHLDNTDTVFGQVYAGMDVVDAIAATKTDEDEKPRKDIEILGLQVYEYTEAPAL